MTADPTSGQRPVSITVCPDGPLLVHGPVLFETADGSPVPHSRSVLALCRCGRSRVKPLCDGSHRQSRFTDPADAAAIGQALQRAASPARPGDDVATP